MNIDEPAHDSESVFWIEEYDCQCCFCENQNNFAQGFDEEIMPGSCERERRLNSHSVEVCRLEADSSATVTLVVGPDNVRIVAPRAVLAFYSRFFDTAFYGSFKESRGNVLTLPEDVAAGISTFVLWAKTGQLYSSLSLEVLWVVGERLQSALFTNEVMFCMYARHNTRPILPEEVEEAYRLTIPASKLRWYIRKLIAYEGPLRNEPTSESEEAIRKGWDRLIKAGGDLLHDIIVEDRASFYEDLTHDESRSPYHHKRQHMFIEEVPDVSAEEFIEAKRKEGKL